MIAERRQAGYSATAITNAPSSIPFAGGTYNVTMSGDLPSTGVEVRAQSGGTAIVSGKVTTSGTAVPLQIPDNASYDERVVSFEYLWNGTWIKIGTDCSQPGYSITSATIDAPETFPYEGGTFTVTLTGNLPSYGVPVRAVYTDYNGTLIFDRVKSSGVPKTLRLPHNRNYRTRGVHFEYEWNGEKIRLGGEGRVQETIIGKIIDESIVYRVGRDNPEDIWVIDIKCGYFQWAPTCRTQVSEGFGLTGGTGPELCKRAQEISTNPELGGTGNFAADFPAFAYCYEKTDSGVDKGTWFLPTFSEIVEDWDDDLREYLHETLRDHGFAVGGQLGFPLISNYHGWTATDWSSDNTVIMFGTPEGFGQNHQKTKSEWCNTRCVRKL